MLEKNARKPKEILVEAAKNTTVTGSSTCCILMLDHTQESIHAANIGDSGFLLLRPNNTSHRIVLRSREQCHSFNFPYQAIKVKSYVVDRDEWR